jgi:hypothetical protein
LGTTSSAREVHYKYGDSQPARFPGRKYRLSTVGTAASNCGCSIVDLTTLASSMMPDLQTVFPQIDLETLSSKSKCPMHSHDLAAGIRGTGRAPKDPFAVVHGAPTHVGTLVLHALSDHNLLQFAEFMSAGPLQPRVRFSSILECSKHKGSLLQST